MVNLEVSIASVMIREPHIPILAEFKDGVPLFANDIETAGVRFIRSLSR